ncbi:MAG: LamG domain-containing protein [Desulfobaccales bacterium]
MKRRSVLLAALTALAFLTCISPGQAALTDNLIGYWAFDGSGADGSGNNRPVTLFGSAAFGTGLFGQALSLPGQADSFAARTVNDAAFNFDTSDFTVQVWVNFTNITGQLAFIEKFTGGSGPGWTLCYPVGVQFYAYPAAVDATAPVSFSLGDWHQLVARRNGTALDIFVDDVKTPSAISGAIPDSPNPLLIGRRQGSQEFPLNGLIDEAAIWSRALTDDEIAYLWNGGDGNPVGVVPLPSTVILLGSGLVGLLGAGWRKFRKS